MVLEHCLLAMNLSTLASSRSACCFSRKILKRFMCAMALLTNVLVATSRNLTSATHEMLKSAQHRKYEPTRRSLLISPEDMIESKQMIELEMEQKRRQAQKRLVESSSLEDQGITAAFLEGDGGEGPSILAAKRDLKRRKS